MRRLGLRGKWSPLKDATEPQKVSILAELDKAEAEGARIAEVRWPAYIGPGCLAEKGGISVDVDGRIWGVVMPDGYVV